MKTSITIIIFLLQTLFIYGSALIETPMPIDSSSVTSIFHEKNIIYIDIASLIFTGYINLNYERKISEHFSLRAGYGFGYFEINNGGFIDYEYKNGFNFSFNFFLGEGNSKFEIDGGLCYIWTERNSYKTKIIYPIIEIDYRYQPQYGGMIYRVGIGTMFQCLGINISLGYTF